MQICVGRGASPRRLKSIYHKNTFTIYKSCIDKIHDNLTYFFTTTNELVTMCFMEYRRIYLDGHSYFITIITYNREPLLIENIDLLRDAFRRSKQKYTYVIDAIVVLPDHLHMIITPKDPKAYSKIISHIKRSFNYGLDTALKHRLKIQLSHSKYKRKHSGIWQERFYEHTIRNEKDRLEKMIYIQNNPVKHDLTERIDEWEYSSFFKSSVGE